MMNTVRTLLCSWELSHGESTLMKAARQRTAPDGSPDPGGEAGMATAEYAVGTLAAAAFAGLLLAIMRSGTLQGALQALIESALAVG